MFQDVSRFVLRFLRNPSVFESLIFSKWLKRLPAKQEHGAVLSTPAASLSLQLFEKKVPGGPGIVSAPWFLHVAQPEAEIAANAKRRTGPLLCLTWKGPDHKHLLQLEICRNASNTSCIFLDRMSSVKAVKD